MTTDETFDIAIQPGLKLLEILRAKYNNKISFLISQNSSDTDYRLFMGQKK